MAIFDYESNKELLKTSDTDFAAALKALGYEQVSAGKSHDHNQRIWFGFRVDPAAHEALIKSFNENTFPGRELTMGKMKLMFTMRRKLVYEAKNIQSGWSEGFNDENVLWRSEDGVSTY